MNESEKWRRYISAWVIGLCLTIALCYWLDRPMRYQNFSVGYAFDMRTGQLISTRRPMLSYEASKPSASTPSAPQNWNDIIVTKPAPPHVATPPKE